MINNEGKVESDCISSSVAVGNIVESFSEIGDIARPGNEVNAETDQMPNNALRVIYPFPVFIPFIILKINHFHIIKL